MTTATLAPTIREDELPPSVRISCRPRNCEFCNFRGYGDNGLAPHIAIPLKEMPKQYYHAFPRVLWLHGECALDLAEVRKEQITLHFIKR